MGSHGCMYPHKPTCVVGWSMLLLSSFCTYYSNQMFLGGNVGAAAFFGSRPSEMGASYSHLSPQLRKKQSKLRIIDGWSWRSLLRREIEVWIMAQQCALSGLSGNRVSAASPACCCAATGRRGSRAGAVLAQCWRSHLCKASALFAFPAPCLIFWDVFISNKIKFVSRRNVLRFIFTQRWHFFCSKQIGAFWTSVLLPCVWSGSCFPFSLSAGVGVAEKFPFTQTKEFCSHGNCPWISPILPLAPCTLWHCELAHFRICFPKCFLLSKASHFCPLTAR